MEGGKRGVPRRLCEGRADLVLNNGNNTTRRMSTIEETQVPERENHAWYKGRGDKRTRGRRKSNTEE